MTGHCICGSVEVTIDAKPEFIHDCNCGLCRKSGGAWGYFVPTEVSTTGKTIACVRADKDNPTVEIHSCQKCAATTHWVLTDGFKTQNPSANQMGVNMRLFNPDELGGVEVRFPNGKDWLGSGAFDYRREPLTIADNARW